MVGPEKTLSTDEPFDGEFERLTHGDRATDSGSGAPARPSGDPQPLYCANHPDRATYVSCSNCGKPICPDCMVYSPVGIKCAECARMPRSALVTLKPQKAARAVGAALLSGTAVGFAYYLILSMGGFFFFLWFAGIAIGAVVGEVVVRASGHYRDRSTALIAVGGTIWAFVFPPLVMAVAQVGPTWDAVVFSVSRGAFANLFALLVAGFVAWQRNR